MMASLSWWRSASLMWRKRHSRSWSIWRVEVCVNVHLALGGDSDKELDELDEGTLASYHFDIVTEFESRMGLEIIFVHILVLESDRHRSIGACLQVFQVWECCSHSPGTMRCILSSLNGGTCTSSLIEGAFQTSCFTRSIWSVLTPQIAKRCESLKSLDIKYCKLVKSTKGLEKLLAGGCLANLEVLDLSGTVFKEDQLLEFAKKLLSSCHQLVLVDFSWTKLNKAVSIQNLLQYESSRQEIVANKRKNLLVLRYSWLEIHIGGFLRVCTSEAERSC